ncbi:MAG: hypothetical protein KJO11_09890 [Gemmatimonadetes bacterium]|nr:hypothetical protein [Gemmatimonadota bacterium]
MPSQFGHCRIPAGGEQQRANAVEFRDLLEATQTDAGDHQPGRDRARSRTLGGPAGLALDRERVAGLGEERDPLEEQAIPRGRREVADASGCQQGRRRSGAPPKRGPPHDR